MFLTFPYRIHGVVVMYLSFFARVISSVDVLLGHGHIIGLDAIATSLVGTSTAEMAAV